MSKIISATVKGETFYLKHKDVEIFNFNPIRKTLELTCHALKLSESLTIALKDNEVFAWTEHPIHTHCASKKKWFEIVGAEGRRVYVNLKKLHYATKNKDTPHQVLTIKTVHAGITIPSEGADFLENLIQRLENAWENFHCPDSIPSTISASSQRSSPTATFTAIQHLTAKVSTDFSAREKSCCVIRTQTVALLCKFSDIDFITYFTNDLFLVGSTIFTKTNSFHFNLPREMALQHRDWLAWTKRPHCKLLQDVSGNIVLLNSKNILAIENHGNALQVKTPSMTLNLSLEKFPGLQQQIHTLFTKSCSSYVSPAPPPPLALNSIVSRVEQMENRRRSRSKASLLNISHRAIRKRAAVPAQAHPPAKPSPAPPSPKAQAAPKQPSPDDIKNLINNVTKDYLMQPNTIHNTTGHFLIIAPLQPINLTPLLQEFQQYARKTYAAGIAYLTDSQNPQRKAELTEVRIQGGRCFVNALEKDGPPVIFFKAIFLAADNFANHCLHHTETSVCEDSKPFLRALDTECVKIYKKFQALAEHLCSNPNDIETRSKLRAKVTMAEGILKKFSGMMNTNLRCAYLSSNITFAVTIIDITTLASDEFKIQPAERSLLH